MSQPDLRTGTIPDTNDSINIWAILPTFPVISPRRTSYSESYNSDPIFSNSYTETRRNSFSSNSSRANSTYNVSTIHSKSIMGNICPNGILETGLGREPGSKPVVMGSGEADHGYGSVISRIKSLKQMIKDGNEEYNKGRYNEALGFYNSAVKSYPKNISSRMNCVDALFELKQFNKAITECDEVIKLDPINARAFYRLTLISLRIGLVELAREYLALANPEEQKGLSEKLQKVEDHLRNGADARIVGDWVTALKEIDATIFLGADSSKYILAFRAEMLLRQHKLEQAQETLSKAVELEISLPCSSPSVKFLGMVPDSYVGTVHAQLYLAFGRFENAVKAVDKAHMSDSSNTEVCTMRKNVRLTSWAHTRGNEMYLKGKYVEAIEWYEEGLKYDSCNTILWHNLTDCCWKLELWVKCVECCNEVLNVRPNCNKALRKRAASFAKIEEWAQCIRDYERVLKDRGEDFETSEDLIQAKINLSLQTRRENANSMVRKEVEEIKTLEQFNKAILIHETCVVYFMNPMNELCIDISPFFESLSALYPSINCIKVNIDQNDEIARNENVSNASTFKIYKAGKMMKEMINPNRGELESSMMHYCF